jgi:hypothetical protein
MQRTLELHRDGSPIPSGGALSWFKGALGEIMVAGILSELGAEWTVLHSVPVGRGDSDIDHVVIGPSGVFTINTKSHPGQAIWMAGHGLLVSGQKTNYIGLAAAEAFRAERALSQASGLTVPVTPVVVLVEPGKRTVRAALDHGVRVLADVELLEFLEGRREFSDEQVQRIAEAAARSTTWRDEPVPDCDIRELATRFNAILAKGVQASMASGAEVVAPTVRTEPIGPAADPGPVGSTPPASAVRAPRPRSSTPRRVAQPPALRPVTVRRARRRKSGALRPFISIALFAAFFYGVLMPLVQGLSTP